MDKSDPFEDLRKKAEELLGQTKENPTETSPEIVPLIQELSVYQSELQIQNEELIQAQKELSSLQREFADLYEFAPCAYLTLSPDGIISRINLTGAKLLGTERAALFRMSFSNFIASEFTAEYFSSLKFAENNREKQSLEIKIKKQNGGHKWVYVDIQPDFFGECELRQWRLTLTDITRQKQAEEARQESESQYKRLFYNSPNLLVEIDADTYEILSCNNAMAERLGSIAEQIEGERITTFLSDSVFKLRKEYALEAIETNKVVTFEDERNGRYFHNTIVPHITDRRRSVQIIALDITERKHAENAIQESEEKYKGLFNSALVGILLHDENGRIIEVNRKAEQIFGISGEDLKQKDLNYWNDKFIDISGEELEVSKFPVKVAAKLKKPVEGMVIGLSMPDEREIRWFIIGARPILNIDGKVEKIVVTFVDITERKQTEKELAAAKERAEESSRLKSTFLSSMSHEIRTPLNAVIGFIDLVLNEADVSSEQRSYLEKAKESGNILLMLINDILDFSKIEANQLALKEESFSLKKLLENLDSIGKMLIQQKSKDIELKKAVRDNMYIVIMGDEYRLEQVLLNLISNAVKFTEKGFIEYGVYFRDKETIEFYIQDTGIGIPEGKKQSIFEPFRQAQEKRTKRYGGTGLGLAISKNLVELMGGEMQVESVVDEGTTFYFTIPYKPGKENEQKNGEVRKPVHQEKIKKILVAEDNRINQLLIKKILQKLGYEVVIAQDGRDAVSVIKSDPAIDLVFMDMFMPFLDGYETTKVIRKLEKQNQLQRIPVIALTAAASNDDKDLMLEAGCDSVLYKPVHQEKIIEIIGKFGGVK